MLYLSGDCVLEVSIEDLPQEIRHKLLMKAVRKGVKPRDLGITPTYLYKLKRKQKPINDHLLRKIIKLLEPEDLLTTVMSKNLKPITLNQTTGGGRSLAWENAGLGPPWSGVQIPAAPPNNLT